VEENQMSLVYDAMEPCTMLDKVTADDGMGGYTTVWTDGAHFQAAITDMTPTEIIAASQRNVKSSYTVITPRSVNLQFYDVFRRESDQKIFRVNKNGNDNKTPRIAELDLRKVIAEEFTIPAE
jgi:hypothetical protein